MRISQVRIFMKDGKLSHLSIDGKGPDNLPTSALYKDVSVKELGALVQATAKAFSESSEPLLASKMDSRDALQARGLWPIKAKGA